MWTAFPPSDYYDDSAPPHGYRPTTGLAAFALAVRTDGGPRGGSHVHHLPIGRVGAQLFPGSMIMPTPQTFSVIPGHGVHNQDRTRLATQTLGAYCKPTLIHQVRVGGFVTGVQPLVHSRYTFLPRLPDPNCLAVPARPGVVRAAFRPLPAPPGNELPSASSTCCDRPAVESSHLHLEK